MSLPGNPRVVITGAGGGLGQAFCRQLEARGARVLASDRPGAAGDFFPCDVTKAEDVEALAAEADRRFGGTDLFINNAGVAVSGRIGEVPLELWKWLLDVNLMGAVHGLHAFVPRMRKARSGHVLNVASAAGLLSSPLMGPYNASKAAVVALSETLFAELQREGVGVTVLCPLFFRTSIADAARGGPEWLKLLIEKLMARDKLGADGVAKFALQACERGDLYALPHPQSRHFWRMKRLLPERMARLTRPSLEALARKLGLDAQI